jgi:hypothetical protein
MLKILINIIEIHMNVCCAEMRSREITYLKMVKTFFTIKTICIQRRQQFHQYQQNEWLHLTSNHRTCRKTVCYPCFNSFFPPFKIYKVFIRAQSDGNKFIAMQGVNIFSNKYSCWLFAQILITLLKNSIILLKNKKDSFII